MRKISFLIFLTLFLTAIAFASDEKQPLRVGFIASFTGPAQIYGETAKNGFELALDELGRDWIQVRYEDDQFTPAKTVTAFKKLGTINKVDLVITIGSTPSNAVAPLAQAQGIPMIAWASDQKVSAGRSQVLRSYPSSYAEGTAAAQEAKRRGYNSFALIVSDNDYALSWKNGFLESFSPAQIKLDEQLAGDSKEFRPTLLKAKKRGTKQLVICVNPGFSGVLAKQAFELGLRVPIFGCENLHDAGEVRAAQGALNGTWFPTITITDEFHQKYMKRFKNDSIISAAAIHYDLAYVLHRAFEKNKERGLIERILELKVHNGAAGHFALKSDQEDRYFDIPLRIKEVPQG